MVALRQKIAAQLYSLRKEIEADPEHVFKTLKEIGFEAVQVDGMRGHAPEEIARLVKKYDFKIAGMHIKHDRFIDDLEGIMQECELFGCRTIYDKYIDDEDQNEVGYRKTKAALIKAAQRLSTQGYRIGLHNPEYDYVNQIDGRNVMAFITDLENNIGIYAEPDTYWMTLAGENLLSALEKYSGRAPILHLKDYLSGFDKEDMVNSLTEVGSGEIDMKAVVAWGEKNGVEYYCIEQDYSKIGMFESMKKGFDYLVSLESEL
jgi:sugar phosphate isomerase/epimerase